MKRDLVRIPPIQSSFLSCDKDTETILNKLFTSSQPHSDILKSLLIVNTKDCLSNPNNPIYQKALADMSVKKMIEMGYITLKPKIRFPEHEEVKAYLMISFDNFFTNNTNPEFRDCSVHFDIICHTDCWELDDYGIRPLKIAGYIDGLLNECKLSGIGTFNFLGCNQLILDENLSGYTLSYRAVHGSDDIIPPEGD